MAQSTSLQTSLLSSFACSNCHQPITLDETVHLAASQAMEQQNQLCLRCTTTLARQAENVNLREDLDGNRLLYCTLGFFGIALTVIGAVVVVLLIKEE